MHYSLKILAVFVTVLLLDTSDLLAQCETQEIIRGDGVKVRFIVPPGPIAGNENVSIGFNAMTNGTDNFVSVIARYRTYAANMEGPLELQLEDGKRLKLDLLQSELDSAGGSEVAKAVFALTDADIIRLKESAISIVTYKPLNRSQVSLQARLNADVLQKQLGCLMPTVSKKIGRRSPVVSDNAHVHPLDRNNGFQEFKFGDAKSNYDSKVESCESEFNSVGVVEICTLRVARGRIADIPYEKVELYFITKRLAKIKLSFNTRYSSALLTACRSAFGEPNSDSRKITPAEWNRMAEKTEISSLALIYRNNASNKSHASIGWSGKSVQLIYDKFFADAFNPSEWRKSSLGLTFQVTNYYELVRAQREKKYSADDF